MISDKQILRFNISVDNIFAVAVVKRTSHLINVLHIKKWQDSTIRKPSWLFAQIIHKKNAPRHYELR